MTKFKPGYMIRVLEGNGWVDPGIYRVIQVDRNNTPRVRIHDSCRLWIDKLYVELVHTKIIVGGKLI